MAISAKSINKKRKFRINKKIFYKNPLNIFNSKKIDILFECIGLSDGVSKKIVELGARKDTILRAFGGGSIGDVIGFVSSIYMRGIAYINIPSTLLSMVDSSLGGKTAINYGGFKNIIGSFYQPVRVCVDPGILSSLSEKDMRSGMGEIIKYGFIHNPDIINELLENYNCIIQQKNKDLLLNIIYQCCSIKKYYIESDERDEGIRNI